jgi:hypothetical protein
MRLRRQVPSNEIGGKVDAGPLLCRSRDVAIYLEGVRVFSNGLQLRELRRH